VHSVSRKSSSQTGHIIELLSIKTTSKRVLPLFVANLTKGPIRMVLNNFGFITPLKPPKQKLKIMVL